MPTVVRVEFRLESIFVPDYIPVLRQYFRGELRAVDAAERLGLTREQWDRMMSGIFSKILRSAGRLGKIEVVEVSE